jgi:hypothetical protein
MQTNKIQEITDIIGDFPYRIALAGGWIDQPFVSRLNPTPPGSMVVISVEPDFMWMNRAGAATSTRKVALQLWGKLPDKEPHLLVEELYNAENKNKQHPSGSQDMIGLIYPGINRLDYDFSYKDGLFPVHIETVISPDIAEWVQNVIHVIPINQRPPGYNPLGIKNLNPQWIKKLGDSGKDCFNAIIHKDIKLLGQSMNICMECWEILMPHIISHPTIDVDLKGLLNFYQSNYPGAMYSGCGGGYLFVASEKPVPGSLHFRVRLPKNL